MVVREKERSEATFRRRTLSGVARIDRRRGKIIVVASSKTKQETWYDNGWFAIVDDDVDDETLGRAVLDALAHVRRNVGDPDYDAIDALLREVGVGDWKDYPVGVQSVKVYQRGKRIELIPMSNHGDKGFSQRHAEAVELERPEARELGAAARAAIDHAVPDKRIEGSAAR